MVIKVLIFDSSEGGTLLSEFMLRMFLVNRDHIFLLLCI